MIGAEALKLRDSSMPLSLSFALNVVHRSSDLAGRPVAVRGSIDTRIHN